MESNPKLEKSPEEMRELAGTFRALNGIGSATHRLEFKDGVMVREDDGKPKWIETGIVEVRTKASELFEAWANSPEDETLKAQALDSLREVKRIYEESSYTS